MPLSSPWSARLPRGRSAVLALAALSLLSFIPGRAAAQQTRLRAPELDAATGWLNTAGPLRLQDLRGKIVLLDFWTLC